VRFSIFSCEIKDVEKDRNPCRFGTFFDELLLVLSIGKEAKKRRRIIHNKSLRGGFYI
jgi:hypothetical protein